MKKIILLLMIVNVMAFGRETPKVRIGMVLSNLENPFFKEMEDGALERARRDNVSVEVVSAEDSPVRELQEIRRFIDEKVDVLIVNPTNSHAVSRGVILANEAGIPVITLDREAVRGDVASHIGSNNLLGGNLAAGYLKENLDRGAKIVELQGNTETTASLNRSRGFEQGSLGELRIILRENADFKREHSYEIMKRVLREEIDVDGVFAHNDESALGALRAVEESGRDVVVVGFDGTDEAEEAIIQGRLDATVKQNPYEMGYMGVESAIKLTKKQWVNRKIDVGVYLIDKKTLTK
ncbi:D-ribose ABC transporter substrate-binding protein [Propionigenium maris DSM 9537]|uniref:D-ribose ABC transporter substrate-binding protein n=1 Tax=Propionigenium maris DSM 9537 TaxID=1123000 RepID=A0A9W6GLU4_9FUSO|nr:substrate-binding domain-containing protein [Propionigenium maris]GLI56515.1 D-ribose ABC transporter substrate-binding protein [Propionigenium maris DSM 9537]